MTSEPALLNPVNQLLAQALRDCDAGHLPCARHNIESALELLRGQHEANSSLVKP